PARRPGVERRVPVAREPRRAARRRHLYWANRVQLLTCDRGGFAAAARPPPACAPLDAGGGPSRFPTALSSRSLLAVAPALSASAGWDPQAFSKQSTLEFLTVGPSEGEHWSTVWLVVIDGDVYIRLGSRAAGRMEQNTTAPYVKLRIAGQQFDRV